MRRRLIGAVCGLAVAFSVGALGGCAEGGTSYPSIGGMRDVSRALSPGERQKALSDLSAEKEKQGQAAK